MADRYERTFGRDLSGLSTEKLVERAFALGVAETLGEAPRDELDALLGEVESAYDRTLVQLAFDEGKRTGE